MNKQHTLKRIVTFILTLIITVTGILFMPNVAHAAEWQQNNKGWRWQENDKTYATSEWKYINNHWYHFNESGYMDTGSVRYYNQRHLRMYQMWCRKGPLTTNQKAMNHNIRCLIFMHRKRCIRHNFKE